MKYLILTGLFLILSSCTSPSKEEKSSAQGILSSDSQVTIPMEGSMGTSGSIRSR